MKENRSSIRETMLIHLRALKDVKRIAPGFLLSSTIYSMMEAIAPYTTIWLSAQMINELATMRRVNVLGKWIFLLVSMMVLVGLLKAFTERWRCVKEALFRNQYSRLFTEKFLQMDYADSDKQETRDLYSQILQSSNWGGWGFNYINMYVCWGVEAIVGILGAVALTVSLFTQKVPMTAGYLTLLNHPLCMVGVFAILLFIVWIGSLLGTKATSIWGSLAEESRFGNRAYSHYYSSLMRDKKKSMDLRMYKQLEMAEYYQNSVNMFGVGSRSAKMSATSIGVCQGVSTAVSALLSGVVYVFVGLKAIGGAFGVGSVTQYVSAITRLTGFVSQLLDVIGHMRTNAGFLKTTYEFLDIPNTMYQGSLTTEKRADRQYEVEFQDVSFKYPGSDMWALRHVNIKFRVGKRLAIVGENGSGKTTFIKLLCRLYDPQEGQILLNGIDIRKYRYDDYMNIFSIVFQDFQLMSQPLGANVAGDIEYDKRRAQKVLEDAGFSERFASMENGLDTMLYKEISDDGVDVSGGEAQKIAIARALYKDAPFIILDEPTAALDPIAEAEIYSRFNDIAGDKTAIYISHRLSSCKFCDEIVVFQEGAVIQQGTHDELVADKSGKYYELWNAQAQYYTE